MTTKIDLTNIADTALTTLTGPKVTTIVYPGDDTATDTVGGAVINLTGNGFQSGCSVLVASTASSVVSFINATQISFVAPALVAGTYVIYVINPDGGTAISIPGISYSGTPNWTTAAGTLGTAYETGAISATLAATGDAPISYSLTTGTLPPGSTLNSNGTLSGTAQATSSATTYSFTIKASDAQNQDTNRAFSITINPDVVTFNTPTDSTTYNVFKDAAIANVAMSATSAAGGSVTYTADTLPTGLSISGANIAGTPTVVASTTTVLTATATSTRSATRTINWVVSIANDTFFKNTTLLLNGETSVTPFISDASTNNLGLTINGDTKPNKFSPYYGDGYYSNYFDGTGDYLTIPNNSAFDFGTGDVTIECWFLMTADPAQDPETNRNAALFNSFIASGSLASATTYGGGIDGNSSSGGTGLSFAARVNGTNQVVSYTGTVTKNVWHHYAFTRTGTTANLYLDGIRVAQNTNFTNAINTNGQALKLGGLVYAVGYDQFFPGYISNARILKGTAAYTGTTFTPSTVPLTAITNTSLLICQSNRLIDRSTNNFTITKNGDVSISPAIPFAANSSYSTYGSAYFDGTGDYLTIASNSNFNLSGSFTVECWFMLAAPPALNVDNQRASTFLVYGNSSQTGVGFEMGILYSPSPNISLFKTGSGVGMTANYTFSLYTWYHVAAVFNGSTSSIFINGVSQTLSTSTWSWSAPTSPYMRIGTGVGYAGYVNDFPGYISDMRIVNGTAVYTTTFTPPTTPLTAIANTSLLTLQYNGGATNSGFIDNSNFNNIVTRFGNTSQGTFSPYSQTGWSNYFSASALTYPTQTTSSSFTAECWFFRSADPANYHVLFSGPDITTGVATNAQMQVTTTGALGLVVNAGGVFTSAAGVVPLGVWSHIVYVRSGTSCAGFVNGTRVATGTSSGSLQLSFLGGGGNGSGALYQAGYGAVGYISNARITLAAVYDPSLTTLTVPTSPLTPVTNTVLLTGQSNRFVDNGPNNLSFTLVSTPTIQAFSPFGSVPEAVPVSYSNYFDGTGDYLNTPASSILALGSSNFTIEFWMRNLELPVTTTRMLGNLSNSTWGPNMWVFQPNAANKFSVGVNNGAALTSTTDIGTSINVLYHIAVTREGNQWSLYVNGVREAYQTYAVSLDSGTSSQIYIGASGPTSDTKYNGIISNLRIVKGTALYTSNFTPSTTPLTAIANTVLLTCQSTTMIDNSTNNFAITAFGDAKPRIFNPFGYTAQSSASYTPTTHGGSAYFDGTGDYLTAPTSASFSFGTSNFTIEAWVNFSDVSVSRYVIDFRLDSSVGSRDSVALAYQSGTGKIIYISGSTINIIGTTAITASQWYHVALVRNSGTTTLFVNGVGNGSVADPTSYTNYTNRPIIGSFANGANTFMFGYISDVRIVNGTSLYTSNFIPPTQTLTSSTSTPASLLLNFTNGGIIDQHSTNVLETVGNAKLSTSVKKYNSASIYFDGTGDYLTIPSSSNLSFGTGDFTIEFWIRPTTKVATYPGLFGNQTYTTNSFVGYERHNNYPTKFSVFCYNYSSAAAMLISTTSVSPDTWYHIAITRSGSNIRLFVDGAVEAAVTFAGSVDGGVPLKYIGIDYDIANAFAGYLDDLRITKGVARYTSNFTAPTSAFITK